MHHWQVVDSSSNVEAEGCCEMIGVHIGIGVNRRDQADADPNTMLEVPFWPEALKKDRMSLEAHTCIEHAPITTYHIRRPQAYTDAA